MRVWCRRTGPARVARLRASQTRAAVAGKFPPVAASRGRRARPCCAALGRSIGECVHRCRRGGPKPASSRLTGQRPTPIHVTVMSLQDWRGGVVVAPSRPAFLVPTHHTAAPRTPLNGNAEPHERVSLLRQKLASDLRIALHVVGVIAERRVPSQTDPGSPTRASRKGIHITPMIAQHPQSPAAAPA